MTIDKRVIDGEIANLEQNARNMNSLEKLAVLYLIKDHMEKEEHEPKMEANHVRSMYIAPERKDEHRSEFMKAVENKNPQEVMKIMDEHMDVVKEFMPKEHRALCDKLKEL